MAVAQRIKDKSSASSLFIAFCQNTWAATTAVAPSRVRRSHYNREVCRVGNTPLVVALKSHRLFRDTMFGLKQRVLNDCKHSGLVKRTAIFKIRSDGVLECETSIPEDMSRCKRSVFALP